MYMYNKGLFIFLGHGQSTILITESIYSSDLHVDKIIACTHAVGPSASCVPDVIHVINAFSIFTSSASMQTTSKNGRRLEQGL